MGKLSCNIDDQNYKQESQSQDIGGSKMSILELESLWNITDSQ